MRAPAPPDLARRLDRVPAIAALRARLAGSDDVWLVGGAIRDLLLGRDPGDLDLVVDGDLAPVIGRLGVPERLHDRFGTAMLTLDGVAFDVARARRERYRRPGALPDVEPAGLTEDLRRRDFTVNALAARLSDGQLEAVPGALDDLAARQLRVLHEASFRDDPTRLLRLARYAGRLGFDVEPGTADLVAAAVSSGALSTVSDHRIGAELVLLAAEADPVAGFRALNRLGLDRALQPGFGLADATAEDRLAAALALLPADGDRVALGLAAALRDVAPGDRAAWVDRLGLTAGRRDAILAAAGESDRLSAALAGADRPSAIARAVGPRPVEAVALAGGGGDERVARAAADWLGSLRHVGLEINGSDLIAAGIPAGPEIGAALDRARAARLDGRATDRAGELAAALGPSRAAG